MAEAIGQLTGKPAAVLGTRAVGAGNMSIGIHTARQNSTPMVALLGQVQRDYLGREAFQEAIWSSRSDASPSGPAEIDDPARRRPPGGGGPERDARRPARTGAVRAARGHARR